MTDDLLVCIYELRDTLALLKTALKRDSLNNARRKDLIADIERTLERVSSRIEQHSVED